MTKTATNGAPAVALLALATIAPSRTNPRKRFDEAELQELADSIRAHGVLQPVLVRHHGKGFELVAGERRWRAAERAGLAEIPAIVRDLRDEEVLEIQLVENLARADLHPLEEAQGYELLHKRHGYSVDAIAAKLGRSRKYVYDRIKLLALTGEAQQHFLEGRITAGHAILLARLDEKDQKRALDPDTRGAVFRDENLLFDRDGRGEGDEWAGITACSVRELESWIDEHVRQEPEGVDQMILPETAEFLEAQPEDASVLAITRHYVLRPDQKGAGKTLTVKSWKRADGKHGSKTCEYARPAIVAIGSGRGEAFDVCIAKEKCKVHWASEQRERARRAKATGKAPPGADAAARKRAAEKEEAARKKAEEERARRRKAEPAIEKACLDAARKAPAAVACAICETALVQDWGCEADLKRSRKELPAGEPSAEDLLRHLAVVMFPRVWEDEWLADRCKGILALLKIDIAKLLDEHAPVEKPANEPAAKKPAKKKAARK